jgi:hypothetical protein
MTLARSGATASGTVSQPTRHPVIRHDLLKLLTTMSRSSSSAIARNDGAALRPGRKISRS